MTLKIIDLKSDNETLIQQVAQILLDAFKHMDGAWSTMEEAVEEVHESFEDDRISRVAIDETGDAVGWIGGISTYDGNVWELHPLCVRADKRGQMIGTALVHDLEAKVKALGGLSIMLGTDDDSGQTSLYGVNLYENTWEHVANIRNLNRHPYEFYQKLGYVITGVVPDGNGINRPDILMSKRIG